MLLKFDRIAGVFLNHFSVALPGGNAYAGGGPSPGDARKGSLLHKLVKKADTNVSMGGTHSGYSTITDSTH